MKNYILAINVLSPSLKVVFEKQFAVLSERDTHSKIHTGEKPYSCSLCQKAFSRNDHLKVHLRIHSGEKPYPCNQCPKAFTQSSDLKRHFRMHSCEKLSQQYILLSVRAALVAARPQRMCSSSPGFKLQITPELKSLEGF